MWAVVSLFVHVTLLPVGTEVVAGVKARSLIVTAVAPPAGAAGAWLVAADGAAEPLEPEQAATAINVMTMNKAVVRIRVIGSSLFARVLTGAWRTPPTIGGVLTVALRSLSEAWS